MKRQTARIGENHFDTAAARGTLAIGCARAGRDADAIREFKTAIPILMAAARENADDDDTTVVAARSQRLQVIVEAYIGAAGARAEQVERRRGRDLPLADAIRGHSVQQALAASSARMVAKDPALAELVRKEQDLGKQINAAARHAQQRAGAAAERARREGRRGASTPRSTSCAPTATRRATRSTKRFPTYADLIDPKPPTVDADQGDAARRRGVAVVLFRPGRQLRLGGAEGWPGRLRRDPGDVARHRSQGAASCARRWSRRRRRSPTFRRSIWRSRYELYALLLQAGRGRLEAGQEPDRRDQRRARPAAAVAAADRAGRGQADGEPLFAGYRDVPWLARTHAVTHGAVGRGAAHVAALAAGHSRTRDKLIGFGDPLFSKEQARRSAAKPVQVADAARASARRAACRCSAASRPQLEGVDSAELAHAAAPARHRRRTEVDRDSRSRPIPTKVLNLGKDANEQTVEDARPVGLQDPRLRHPRPGAGRAQRADASRRWRCPRPTSRAPTATAC